MVALLSARLRLSLHYSCDVSLRGQPPHRIRGWLHVDLVLVHQP